MNLKAKIIIRELSKYRNPVILETGCIRHTDIKKAQSDGGSTYYIANWLKQNKGKLHSIDNKNTGKAKELLKKEGLLSENIHFHEGGSLEILRDINMRFVYYDFVLLDSANDADLILSEYLLIKDKVKKQSTIIVDDVNMSSHVKKKGHKLIPYLKEINIPFRIENEMCIICHQ